MPLIDAYAVACYDQNGLWMWDENVVAEHDSVSNEDGTLTYTIKLTTICTSAMALRSPLRTTWPSPC